MIELKNITLIKDEKTILNNINLTIADNVTTVVTGPNGSGKSTLMKIIMGIETPTSGQVILDGKDITNLSINERANLGLSFAMQQPVKFKGITVRDLLHISAGSSSKEKICSALSAVGLCPKDYLDREIGSTLSGGELKRIEIASVILRKSKYIIFDEPEAGIDIWSFSKLINLFNKLCSKHHNGIIIVSHQEKIINIANELVLIKAGQIVEDGKDEYYESIKSLKKKKCKKINN